MIIPALSLDQVAHRQPEAGVEFVGKPARRLGVDRVGNDDAVGSDVKDRKVEVVLEAIEVAGNVGDLASGLVLRLGNAELGEQQGAGKQRNRGTQRSDGCGHRLPPCPHPHGSNGGTEAHHRRHNDAPTVSQLTVGGDGVAPANVYRSSIRLSGSSSSSSRWLVNIAASAPSMRR